MRMFDPSPVYYALQAIGFATGAALCCMFGALQMRVERAEKLSSTYPRLWAICLAWNIGNFLQYSLILAGHSPTSTPVGAAALLAWSAVTGAMPYILLTVQRSLQLPPVLKIAPLFLSTIVSAAIVFLFGAAVFSERAPFSFYAVIGFSFADAVAHWVVGGLLFLVHLRSVPVERTSPQRRVWFKTIVGALLLVAAQTLAYFTGEEGGWLNIVPKTIAEQWSIPFVVVMAAFLADWIYADVVLKRTLRLLVCVCIAAVLMYLLLGKDADLLMVFATIAVAALSFGAPWLKQKIDAFVDTVLLKRPDYDAIAARFVEQVSHAASKDEVMALMQATTRDALKHRRAQNPALTMDIPLATYTPVPESVSQLFMQGELAFVRNVATEADRRLDVLANEIERREATVREERLRFEAKRAELSALRAQVDPHFLFNTLNAIADQITTAPKAAEAMTERLADFFRYTLTRTPETMATVHQELEFARLYLEIEAARFGERLQVQINHDPAADEVNVPALILQPLVENAVRHGIAPQRQGGAIRVSSQQQGRQIELIVADNGIGMSSVARESGIGLKNVRERMKVLYGEKATVTIAAGQDGRGTVVTLRLPINAD